MERKKFTTTLSVDIIKQLNIIAAINDFNSLNSTIEFLVKKYLIKKQNTCFPFISMLY